MDRRGSDPPALPARWGGAATGAAALRAAQGSRAAPQLTRYSGRGVAGCAEDVHHEDQGVGALDARRGVAGLAVSLGWRDHQQDPAANGDADQALVPAGNDLGWQIRRAL